RRIAPSPNWPRRAFSAEPRTSTADWSAGPLTSTLGSSRSPSAATALSAGRTPAENSPTPTDSDEPRPRHSSYQPWIGEVLLVSRKASRPGQGESAGIVPCAGRAALSRRRGPATPECALCVDYGGASRLTSATAALQRTDDVCDQLPTL